MDEMLSVPQVAEELGITEGRVRQLLYDGTLKGQRVGWQWVILRTDLERYKRDKRPPGRPRKK